MSDWLVVREVSDEVGAYYAAALVYPGATRIDAANYCLAQSNLLTNWKVRRLHVAPNETVTVWEIEQSPRLGAWIGANPHTSERG